MLMLSRIFVFAMSMSSMTTRRRSKSIHLPLKMPSSQSSEEESSNSDDILYFRNRYFQRLDFDLSRSHKVLQQPLEAEEEEGATIIDGYDLLCQLTEVHLFKIPFENLAQHGGYGGLVSLNPNDIATKILDRKRGGFCLELNLLFGKLLENLGYKVTIIPAIVYAGDDIGFRGSPTHILLEVTTTHIACNRVDTTDVVPPSSSTFLVDVGFGEPPLHPLLYEFDIEQVTPEGMNSRLILKEGEEEEAKPTQPSSSYNEANIKRNNEHNKKKIVQMEWYIDGKWIPRLQWEYNHHQRNTDDELLSEMLKKVCEPTSIFSRKFVVVHLTRQTKHTLSGNTYKRTGPPRFGSSVEEGDDVPTINKQQLNTLDEVRTLLETEFRIPQQETETIDFQKLSVQDPNLFGNF